MPLWILLPPLAVVLCAADPNELLFPSLPFDHLFPNPTRGDPIIYVSVEPCPNRNCRLGHTMANIATAFILSELFNWRYLHSKKLNDQVGNLFDFTEYRKRQGEPTPKGIRDLEGKHNPKKGIIDPAVVTWAGDERWSGHVSYEHVQRAASLRVDACRRTHAFSCAVKLKYSWRISIRRVWLWSSQGFVDPWAAYRVSERLVHAYCKRMTKEPEVYPYLFAMNEVAAADNALGVVEPTTEQTLTIHARRGDRDEDWVKKMGVDVTSLTAVVRGLFDATSPCFAGEKMTWKVSAHSEEGANSADLDMLSAENLLSLKNDTRESAFNINLTVFRDNSLVKDLAMMLASDIFIMGPSSLSVLVEGMRIHISNQTGGITVHDVRINKATLGPSKAQYVGDLAGTRMEPSSIRWDATRGRFLELFDMDCAQIFQRTRAPACCRNRFTESPVHHVYTTFPTWASPTSTPNSEEPPVSTNVSTAAIKHSIRPSPPRRVEMAQQELQQLTLAADESDSRASKLNVLGEHLDETRMTGHQQRSMEADDDDAALSGP